LDYSSKKQVIIKIGELYATDEPTIIHTVLGSCVAVCIYDDEKMIGGMNHIFMPGDNKNDSSTRYGENAMKYLIKNICTLGPIVIILWQRPLAAPMLFLPYPGSSALALKYEILLSIILKKKI
jgi:hypothetical protein